MKRKTEILSFFTTSDNVVSKFQLNNLIEKAYQIAIKYLHFNQLKISKLILREEITIQELAIDCIAGLFVKEDNSELISIQQTFRNWEPFVTSEDDCLYFLNKIVANRVEQHIFKILKEEDPFFSKLLDSVTYLIRTSGYNKIHFLGKAFITETMTDEFEKNFISIDEFEKLPAVLFRNKKTLLNDLFNYFKNETEFNAAIPLNDLINKLRHINFSEFLISEFVNNEYKKIEVNEIVDDGFNFAIDKLLNGYVEKGKLDRDEKIAFELALKEMANDLSDGGVNPGLFNYLKPHLKDLNEIIYKEKYHNILEYLLKVMKNKIAERLTEKD